MAKYSEVFQRHEVDLQTFASLTEDELKEIGINAFGQCLIIIRKLNQVSLSVNSTDLSEGSRKYYILGGFDPLPN